ncbi:dthadh [Symbiodinium microadriaticum]|nr:dthadh [Symbiodinium microadriaticum]
MAAQESPASALLENEDSKPIPPITAVYSYLMLFVFVMLAIAWRAEVNGAGSLVWIMTWMAVTAIRRPFEKDQQANTIAEKVHMSTEKALLCCVLLGMYFIPVIFLLTGFPGAADHDDPGPWSIAVASAVTLPALYLFWRSHVDLGRNWSPTTELREHHTLVTTGVYRQGLAMKRAADSTIAPARRPQWGCRQGESDSTTRVDVDDLVTPCYVAYHAVVLRNAEQMLARARRLGCRLRPHMKTHKTLEGGVIATGGTCRGITVSTLAEAEFFANGGFDDICYAVPITADKLPRAALLVERLEAFHVTVDHSSAVEALLERPPSAEKAWSVFLMVDCGYGRDGVDPEDPATVGLARRLAADPSKARLAGLYTHGGHSYDQEGSDVVSQVRLVAAAEARAVAGLAGRLREVGLEVPTVGVGSTPTCSNPPDALPDVNEMHPGNYIYYDTMQQALGSCAEEDIAVRVLTRVIGAYPKKNLLLVDMGWTACSKQGQAMNYGRFEGHPELKVVDLKQEAGLISSSDGKPLDFAKYPLGAILRLEPFHSCAHTKQHDRIHVLAEDRTSVVATWKICHGW